MKKIVCMILSLVMAFSLAGCVKIENDGLETVTIVLDWTPNTNHTGLYVAEKLGYYDEAGLNVIITQPPEGGAEALVASGKAEFGISFQDSMAPALSAEEELDIVAVAAICQHNLSGIISRKDKGIDSFGALEGKTYATWGSPIEQSIIGYCMEREGANVEKLSMIDSTVTDVLTALDTDMIDTVWVYEYWDVVKAQLEGYDYNYIDFKSVDETMDYYTPVIISSGKFIEEKYDIAKKFISATKKGYMYASKNPEEAAEILLDADPTLDRDLVMKSSEFMASWYVDENGNWGKIDKDRWNKFYLWLYENGLIEKDLTDKGFTMQVLND